MPSNHHPATAETALTIAPVTAKAPSRARPARRSREPEPLYPELPETSERLAFQRAFFLRTLAEYRDGEAICRAQYGKRLASRPARMFVIGALVEHERTLRRAFDDWVAMENCEASRSAS